MRHPIARWAALLLVAALYGTAPAHAQGACDAGDTLLGSKTYQDGGKTFRTDYCTKAPGPWSRADLDHIFNVWSSMPDTPAKAWVIKNISFVRRHDTPICMINMKGEKICETMPSPYASLHGEQATLTFNDRFFQETPAVQQSLFAIESGKAFYLKLDIGSRFDAYAPAMDEMLLAGKASGEPNADRDAPSQFGGLFRIAMLQTSAKDHPAWTAPLAKLDALLRKLTPSP
jgi:hypothetical protein